MAAAGAIQARCLRMLRSKCRPGVTTAELDDAAARFIASQGAEASFLGYRGFPKSICTSPNSMVVHGIPGPYELRRGDVISAGVGEARPGNHLGDVSAAIQRTVEAAGFSIIRSLVGHGIGRSMHEDPQIP